MITLSLCIQYQLLICDWPRMDEEILRWETDPVEVAWRVRKKLGINEVHLLQLCCWAMDGTIKQRRLAGLLLYELHEAATIREHDIKAHCYFPEFSVECGPFLDDGAVPAEDIARRLLVGGPRYQADFAAAIERMYGAYPYCGKADGQDWYNVAPAKRLHRFARLLETAARRTSPDDAGRLKTFEALTELGKAQRENAIEKAAARREEAMRCRPAWVESDRSEAPVASTSGRGSSSSRPPAPTIVGHTSFRRPEAARRSLSDELDDYLDNDPHIRAHMEVANEHAYYHTCALPSINMFVRK